MTAIAALVHNGTVYMGGDCVSGGNTYLTKRADEKVFINGNFIIGFTDSFRMGQLLRFNLKVAEQESTQSDYEYMATTFIDAVRECLKQGGYTWVVNNRETGGQFIVGYKGELYIIHNDFQVGKPLHNYAAVGCGFHLCLGSLFSTKDQPPKTRIKKALEAAQEFSAYVRAPFTILSLKKHKV